MNYGKGLILAGLAVLGFLASAPSHAQYITIWNDQNKSCIQFESTNPADNVPLRSAPCAGYSAYQQHWTVVSAGHRPDGKDIVLLQNWLTRTCIAVENNSMANAARLVQRACNVNDTGQQWWWATRDAMGVKSKWLNVNSGKCLDMYTNPMQQYDCAPQSYWWPQMWRMSFDASEPTWPPY